MLTIKIAFRNIFRQRRRSFLTGLSIAGGFVLFSVAISIFEGTYGNIIDIFIHDHTGHVQIHKKGYLDSPTIYKTIKDYDIIEKRITGNPEVVSVTGRVIATALSFRNNHTAVVRVIGVDPQKEKNATHVADSMDSGAFLSDKSSGEAVLGYGVMKLLEAKIGDEISLLGQGADGSIANENFKIIGVIGKGNSAYNRVNCFISIRDADSAFSLDGRIHEIAVMLKSGDKSREAAIEIASILKDDAIRVDPWQDVEKIFYSAMQTDKRSLKIIYTIMVILIAIGVLNTVLMTILERTREYGVLKALGTRPIKIFFLIVLEISILGVMAVTVGAIISLVINYFLSIHGIPYGPLVWGGFIFNKLLATIDLWVILLPGIVTLSSSVLVSIIPAIHAARVAPVTALRHH